MKNVFVLFIFLVSLNSFSQNDYNKLNSNGQKQGVWKGFYSDSKRLRYEGTFENGKEVGLFNFYDDTKTQSVIATRNFNITDNSAYTIFYDQKKNVVSEGKVVNKLYEGEWKYYHEASKVVMTQEFYKNGKLNGSKKIYFPSGKIAEEANYVNNIREGKYKKYTEDGIALEESNYKKGEFDGIAIFKDPIGNVVAKGIFKEGKKVGIWEFFENGKKVSQDDFSKPRKKFDTKAKPKAKE
jgi:antitoxin component YwqK of YwqJK toxin-antitoxin module